MSDSTFKDGFHEGQKREREKWERLIAESPRALAFLNTAGKYYKLSDPSYSKCVFVYNHRGIPDNTAYQEVALVPVPKPVEEGDET